MYIIHYKYNPHRRLSGARRSLHQRECIACRSRARLGLAGVEPSEAGQAAAEDDLAGLQMKTG